MDTAKSWKQGLYGLKWLPLGYLNDKETKQIYLDKEKAPLVKKTFEAYATGNYTLKNLRRLSTGLVCRTGRQRRFTFHFKFSVSSAKSVLLRHYPLQRQILRKKARTDYYKETLGRWE